MKSHRPILVLKIGGSVATFKDRVFATRLSLLEAYARLIRKLDASMLVVLGGGSYGHYEAARCKKLDASCVSRIAYAMNRLATIAAEVFSAAGLAPVIYPPHAMCDPRGLTPRCDWNRVEAAFEHGLLPVTYGDVYVAKGGVGIVSGDELAVEAACRLKAVRLVYATSVDGVYSKDGRLIRRITRDQLELVLGEAGARVRGFDVTGGMRRKLEAILANACEGLRVYIVNGFRLERVEAALKGLEVEGTIISL